MHKKKKAGGSARTLARVRAAGNRLGAGNAQRLRNRLGKKKPVKRGRNG